MSAAVLRVGSRPSSLAQIQATFVLRALAALIPQCRMSLLPIASPGDRDRKTDLRQAPEDFFTRDLDQALADGRIDCAVHSAKDLPSEPVPGQDWQWLPWRAEARDALVLAAGRSLAELPAQARIGISSQRRAAWAAQRFPQATCLPIRGDIEQRLAQLDAGDYDAVLIAGAALQRLGLLERVSHWIPCEELPVPPGQGVLALTFRADDPRMRSLRSFFTPAIRFVGAGVGDPRWLTLAAVEALAEADYCLYDDLLPHAVLDYLPAGATAVAVGKRCERHRVEQEEICRMLIDAARRGQRVLRLKGGDPCIFARLTEEVAACERFQIPYEVIPGISSMQVASAVSGAWLTSRGERPGFSVLSPRAAGGGRLPIDARQRAALPQILFMARHLGGEIGPALQADGYAPDTPVMVVDDAGGWQQQIHRTQLADLPELAAPQGGAAGLLFIDPPPSRPRPGVLAGERVAITASSSLQQEAARRLRDHGAEPLALPLIRLQVSPQAVQEISSLGSYDWLVFTSPSSVNLLLDLAGQQGISLHQLPRILACGPGTTRALRARGLQPDFLPQQDFGAVGLLDLALRATQRGERVLVPRSDRASSSWPDELRAEGRRVDAPQWLCNQACAPPILPACDAALFMSPSAVTAWIAQWGAASLPAVSVAIGPPTAQALRGQSAPLVLQAEEATLLSCVHRLAAWRLSQSPAWAAS